MKTRDPWQDPPGLYVSPGRSPLYLAIYLTAPVGPWCGGMVVRAQHPEPLVAATLTLEMALEPCSCFGCEEQYRPPVDYDRGLRIAR